ncbi:hypothetical protein BKA61DRAFT_594595 [Leptodontidium sp. MPI-SDFR-AT-0119]|nr:hypothetical protein BKA61DRAFT_594595 [Leptodontidium sp. MPI-SDFR-AT-0119]
MKAQAQGCTLLFALHSLTTVAQCGPLIAERDIFMPLVTQRDIGIECRLSVSTDIWTTCLTFITMYNITLPEMFNMNPLVEADCFGFKPGSEYCVMALTRAPTSKNGLCGIQSPTKVTCVNSGFGDCCGSSGRCGSTDEFCAIGNCQEGDCPGLGYSTDGFCGGGHDDTVCGGKWGACCSKLGRCGSSITECGPGNCESGACVSSTTSTASTPPTVLPSPISPSPDGTCGYIKSYKCTDTKYYFGNCCSAAGYCGTSQYHCDNLQGCQAEFGLCDRTLIQTITVNGTTGPPSTSSGQSSRSVGVTTSSIVSRSTTSISLTRSMTSISSTTSSVISKSTLSSSLSRSTTAVSSSKTSSATTSKPISSTTTTSSSRTTSSPSTTSKPISSITTTSSSRTTSSPTSTALPISPDGRCGQPYGNTTCTGSSFGKCCSIRSNCGSTPDYCGTAVGCQLGYGTCTPISLDGRCGAASTTGATCVGSSFGQCCSVKGNCGDSAAFCAVANLCQPMFGTCSPTSTDGKCGAASSSKASCSGSTFGNCCSVKGNCGGSDAFCATNNLCQPNFGTCYPTSLDGKCGSASSTSASCSGSTFGKCCSVKGNCGDTAAFCAVSNLCQPTFGTCT